jgi:hypothetical protein
MKYENRQQLQGYLDTLTRQVLSLPSCAIASRGRYIEDLRKIKRDLQMSNYDIAEFELERIKAELDNLRKNQES